MQLTAKRIRGERGEKLYNLKDQNNVLLAVVGMRQLQVMVQPEISLDLLQPLVKEVFPTLEIVYI